MSIKLANNAFATLASSITSSATSITLTTGQGARFPSLGVGDYFYATLVDTSNNLEIVKCTARSTDVLTVVRGQESTTARAYSTGDRIEIRLTAQTFLDATAIPDGSIEGVKVADDTLSLDKLSATGTRSSSTYLRGDDTFAEIPSPTGGATVSSSSITLNTSATKLQVIEGTSATTTTLAAATSFADEGINLFQVKNFATKSSSIVFSDGWYGNDIGPGEERSFSLSDNSAAVAGWTYTNDARLKIKPSSSLTAGGMPADYCFDIAVMTDTTVICVFSGTSADIYYSVGTISSGSISWSSPTLMFTATAYKVWLTRLTDTTAILNYLSVTGGNLAGTISSHGLTLSGSTITQSAAGSTLTSSILNDVIRLDDTRVMVNYVTGTATTVRVLTHNGGSAPTWGSAATLIGSAAIAERTSAITLVDTDKVVAFYTDPDGTSINIDAYARVASVSGTTITLGTQITLSTLDSSYCSNKQAYSFDSSYAFNTDGWAVSISGTSLTSLGLIAYGFGDTNNNTAVVPMSSDNAILMIGGSVRRGKYTSGEGVNFTAAPVNSKHLQATSVVRANASKNLFVSAYASGTTIYTTCGKLIEA